MSFDIDDPLAGILSDGSDDSFFDDDILGKKKPAKKKITPTAEKKNALFDLGESDKTKPVAAMKDPLDFDSKKSPTPFKRTLSKESIKISQSEPKVKLIDKIDLNKSPGKVSASTNKLDILGEISGPRKEAPKTSDKGKSTQSLFDDILGGSSVKTGSSSQVRPATSGKSQDFDINDILGKQEPKNIVSSKNLPQKPIIKESTKEESKPTSKSKSSDDWLGIFQDKEVAEDDEDDSGMPSWLGGGSKKKATEKKVVPKTDLVKDKPKEEPNTEETVENAVNKTVNEEAIPQEIKPEIVLDIFPPTKVQGSYEVDVTTEGAALYLQQQESQLMVALQLKAQEEKLAAMQRRQKESQRVQREATQAQNSQMDAMLRRQAENRDQMQSIISAHQERITQRIKALLTTENNDNEYIHLNDDDEVTGHPRETPHNRERKQLLQLVQSLQENHDKEIDLMETSYRRQLAFLEVSLNQSEERMKEESDKLVKFYSEKINWLEEHHHLYKKLSEENLTALTERHKNENEVLSQQHLENVKVLQEHYVALMENIKNAVKKEQVLIQDAGTFSTDLKTLLVDLEENKHHCQQLVDKVQALAENTEKKTDSSVQIRESQINELIQQLKKERENFDIEKSENREINKMLESRLKQMTTMIEEESATLKQKRMEFEFEKATFSKQTEFAKNVLKRQEEEIKILREDIQKEYQERTAKIAEEKSKALKESTSIARDKSSIQSIKQDLEKMKAELQAQLEEVAEDRSKLNIEKQQTHMEEQRILAKSRDLDLLAKTAIEKQTQADKKYNEAEFIQRKYEERIRRIQEHVVSLNAREKQIAREKVALSRERLNLHNERKQIDSRQQCSLCKSIPSGYDPSYLHNSFMHTPLATRDYNMNTNVDSAMSAIEREMSHLMSKNLNLRHSAGIGDLSRHREDVNERVETATQESGIFKDYNMDPKFMMLRLDVQQVISNLDQSKKDNNELTKDDDPHED